MTNMNKKDKKGSVNIWAFWPAFVALIIFICIGIFCQKWLAGILDKALYGMANSFGWYLNLFALACFIIVLYFAISKYGNVKIGGDDAKPEFSYFHWIAMTICGGIGTGLLFWAMGEPLFHFYEPPAAAGVEAASRSAAIFAVSQSMWNWSFVEFSIYTVCSVAFTVAIFNRRKALQFSSVLDPLFKKRHRWLETLIHGIMIFAMVGGVANSMGVGLMQIGAGFEASLGIKQSDFVYLCIAIFIGCVFVLMCLSGIKRGLKWVSTFTITVFFGLLAYVIIFGDPAFIGKIASESFGEILNNWGGKTLINNALSKDNWAANWTIQYWASFILYAPVFGMFFCRMAKGRTIRQFILVNVIIPSTFCCFWISVFGGMSIHLQTSGTLDIWKAIQTYGMQTAVFQIIGSMPAGHIVQIIFVVAIIGSFTTMADPIAAVLATMSVHKLSVDDEAPKKFKILMGVMITTLAYVLVATDGVTAVKSMYVILGLPVTIICILCIVSAFKQMKQVSKFPDYMLPETDTEEPSVGEDSIVEGSPAK